MKNRNKRTKQLVVLTIFLAMLLIVPGDMNGTEREPVKKKIQLEIFAGYNPLNPAAFNQAAEAENQYREFLFDRNFQYQEAIGETNSQGKEIDGEYNKIRAAVPFGFRLKYHLNPSVALSVGLEYFKSQRDSEPDFSYWREEGSVETYYINRDYAHYRLSVRGCTPTLGIHLEKHLTRRFGIEGFVTGGIVFGQCRISSQSITQWVYRNRQEGFEFMLNEYDVQLEQEGKGVGAAFEGGMRLNYRVGGPLGIFLEGGYAYRSIGKIKGPGMEIRSGIMETWDAEWGMRTDNMETPWGEAAIEYPGNYWNDEQQKSSDFKLALSGFRLKMGLFIRF